MFRIIIAVISFVAIVALGAPSVMPQEEPPMVEVGFSGHTSYPLFTRLVFDTGGVAPEVFKVNYDDDGRRVVFYPKAGLLAFSFAPVEPVDDVVSDVDFVQADDTRRGIIVRLTEAATGLKVSYLSEPDRLVLDIYRKASAVPFLPLTRGVKTIALDPGHGGRTRGSAGPAGLSEKDLTLDVVLRLKDLLVKDGYRVVLTRTKDADVSPDERAGIANNARADLYISVHSAGSFGAAGGGVSVYTVDAGEGGAGAGPLGWSSQNAPYLPESLRLAKDLSVSVGKLYKGDSVVHQARLRGISGLAMPAVIVELGDLTDQQQEEDLADDAFRDKLASRLAEGIRSYVKGVES